MGGKPALIASDAVFAAVCARWAVGAFQRVAALIGSAELTYAPLRG